MLVATARHTTEDDIHIERDVRTTRTERREVVYLRVAHAN